MPAQQGHQDLQMEASSKQRGTSRALQCACNSWTTGTCRQEGQLLHEGLLC